VGCCTSGAAGGCRRWGESVGSGSLGNSEGLFTFFLVGHDKCEPDNHEDDTCDECGDEEDEEDSQRFVVDPHKC